MLTRQIPRVLRPGPFLFYIIKQIENLVVTSLTLLEMILCPQDLAGSRVNMGVALLIYLIYPMSYRFKNM